MIIMELALRQSLMVISTTDVLLYAKYISPLYDMFYKFLCCCLHINYIVYQHKYTLGHQNVGFCEV